MTTIIIDDELAAVNVIRHYLKEDDGIVVIGEAHNGEDALAIIKDLQPDLIFLDIQMPELSGFELLQQLPQELFPTIIFTTAYDHYAVKAFEFSALDYLLKPFTRERFQNAVQKAKTQFQSQKKIPDYSTLAKFLAEYEHPNKFLQKIAVKNKDQIQFVDANDIIWIESHGKFCKLHLATGFRMDVCTRRKQPAPGGNFSRRCATGG